MKIFYPKNIDGGWLNLSFPIGPFKVTLLQLLVIAAGAAASLAVWQGVAKSSKTLAIIIALPIMIVFLIVAFFEISEMNLGHFVTKLIRTHILDETIKFQKNNDRIDQIDILSKRVKIEIEEAERIVSESKEDEKVSTDQLKKVDIVTQLANK